MPRLDSFKLNPFQGASALFLILSPFLTWITIVSFVVYHGVAIFGTAAQSNLLMVSSQQLGTNISFTAAAGALLSVILLVAGGIGMLRSAKVGVPLSVAGLLAYLVPFYPMFGTTTFGLQYTFVSPGIGVFSAAVGIGMGLLSSASKAESLSALASGIRSKRGLSNLGVSIGVIGLTLDFLNHFALGQTLNFVGLDIAEQTLHLGLVAGVASLLIVVAFGMRAQRQKWLFGISIATLSLLGADATFNIVNGTLHEFLGHNLTETVLHLAVYYGVALVTVSNFLHRE